MTDIPASQAWLDEIYAGIETAAKFVFCVSPNTLTSFVCQLELTRARVLGKPIIAVMLEDMPKEREGAILQSCADKLAQLKLSPFDTQALHVALESYRRVQRDENLALISPDSPPNQQLSALMQQNYWNCLKAPGWIYALPSTPPEAIGDNLLAAVRLNLDYLRFINGLTARMREWQEGKQARRWLLRGGALDEALRWLAIHDQQTRPLTPQQVAFIERSRQTRQSQRWITALVSLIALVIIAFVGWEAMNQNNARRANARVISARQLADDALTAEAGYQAISLVMAANQLPNVPPEAEEALLNTLDVIAPRHIYFADPQQTQLYGALALASDGRVYLGGYDGSIIEYSPDGRSSRRLQRADSIPSLINPSEPRPWEEFDLYQDRYLLARYEDDTVIMVWDIQTGQIVSHLQLAEVFFSANITQTALSRPLAASLIPDGVAIWDIQTGQVRCMLGVENLSAATLTADGQHVMVSRALADSPLQRYDTQTCKHQTDYQFVDAETIYTVQALLPLADGSMMAHAYFFDITGERGYREGFMRWDSQSGAILHTVALPQTSSYGILTDITPDGRRGAISDSGGIGIYDLFSGRQLSFISTPAITRGVALSDDGRQLVVGASQLIVADSAQEATVFDLNDRRASAFLFDIDRFWRPIADLEPAQLIVMSGDGDWFARVDGREVQLIRRETWTVEKTLRGHLNPIQTLAFSPDGRWLATSDGGEETFIWSTETGKLQHELDLIGYRGVRVLRFSPDQRLLLVAGDDHLATPVSSAMLWDVQTGEKSTVFDSFGLSDIRQAEWMSPSLIVGLDEQGDVIFLDPSRPNQVFGLGDEVGDVRFVNPLTADHVAVVSDAVRVYRVTPSVLGDRLVSELQALSAANLPRDVAPSGLDVQDNHVTLAYPTGLLVLPLVNREPDSLIEPTNTQTRRQLFTTTSPVQTWFWLDQTWLALYPDGGLDGWQPLPIGYQAAKSFLQDNRVILPLTCQQQARYGLIDRCEQMNIGNVHVMALGLPPTPPATAVPMVRAVLPTYTPLPAATDSPIATPSIDSALAALAQEGLPFQVERLPVLEGYDFDFYVVERDPSVCQADTLTQVASTPGTPCVSVYYQGDLGQNTFVLFISASPYPDLATWQTASSIATLGFHLYQTQTGFRYAYNVVGETGAWMVFQHQGVFYSIFPTRGDLSTEQRYALISHISAESVANLAAASLERPAAVLSQETTATPRPLTLADVPFSVFLPEQVGDFRLIERRAIDNAPIFAALQNIGVTSDIGLELVYQHDEQVIRIRQYAIRYTDLDVMRSEVDSFLDAERIELGGTSVLAQPQTNAYYRLQSGLMVAFLDDRGLSRSVMFDFITAWNELYP